MSFTAREVVDRIIEHPGRYQLVLVEGTTDTYDLVAVPGTVTAEGTAINKVYLQPLEDGLASVEVQQGSYLAFCANVNSDSIDAAFGKNNTDLLKGIGRQLAMYAWFKGASKTTYPFTATKLLNTFSEIIVNETARNEVGGSKEIIGIASVSPYALSIMKPYLPTPSLTSNVVIASTLNTASTTTDSSVETTVASLTVPYSGVYTIHPRAAVNLSDDDFYIRVYVNGVLKLMKSGTTTSMGYWNSIYDFSLALVAGDVITLSVQATGGTKYWYGVGIVLTADRDLASFSGASGGDKAIWIDPSIYVAGSTGKTSAQFICPYTQTYRVYMSGYAYSAAITYFSLRKNGVDVVYMAYVGTYYDIECNAGDILTGYVYGGSGSSVLNCFAVCVATNPNIYPTI